MNVTLRNLSKRFGTTAVVKSVTLDIADGELFFLLGPSGCGKTTLLRLLAGFYQPDDGDIRFGDRAMNDVPPNRRNTGMVFQNYALWPHLSVFENVAYGLDVRNITGTERSRRVAEALAIVQMSDYARRSPAQLSGGQQQRIALARALVIKPDVLLLDEPLSNLDAKLRLEMREEIRRIHRETKLATIYVTHDQQEALALADRIALMREGAIEQVGTPLELYRNPRTAFVSEFLGAAHFIEGNVVAVLDNQRVRIHTPLGEMECAAAAKVGDRVTCAIRPNDVIALRG
jgi:iron(III) transport system ATP-binding protein